MTKEGLAPGYRVIDVKGQAGTVHHVDEVDPTIVYVQLDAWRPSSEPLPRLLTELTFVSKP